MSFNDHKRVIKQLLCQYFPSFFYNQCPTGIFPRAVYDIKQLDVADIPYEEYRLTLDFFDVNTTEAIDDAIDAAIAAFRNSETLTTGYYYKFFYGNDRQNIPDPDKTIRHIMLSFEVRAYKRSE